jgi:hypothetical protein
MRSLYSLLGSKKTRPSISAPSLTPPKRKSLLKRRPSRLTTPVLPRRLKKPKTVKTNV